MSLTFILKEISLIVVLTASLFFFRRSPLSLRVWLLGISILRSLSVHVFLSKWLGLSLVLIFTGGVMILILYLVAVSDTRILYFSKPLFSFFLMLILFFRSDIYRFLSFHEFYRMFNRLIIIIRCGYLLTVLFLRVRLCSLFKGRLIKKI